MQSGQPAAHNRCSQPKYCRAFALSITAARMATESYWLGCHKAYSAMLDYPLVTPKYSTVSLSCPGFRSLQKTRLFAVIAVSAMDRCSR